LCRLSSFPFLGVGGEPFQLVQHRIELFDPLRYQFEVGNWGIAGGEKLGEKVPGAGRYRRVTSQQTDKRLNIPRF